MAVSARPIRVTWKRRHWTLTPTIGSIWLHESLAHYSRSKQALRGEYSKDWIAFAFCSFSADIADISNTVPSLIMTPCNAPHCPMHLESLRSKHGSYLNVMLKNIIPPTTMSPSEGSNPRAINVTKRKGRARNNWTKLMWRNITRIILAFFVSGVFYIQGHKHHQTSLKLNPIFCAMVWTFIRNQSSVTSATCGWCWVIGPSTHYMPGP